LSGHGSIHSPRSFSTTISSTISCAAYCTISCAQRVAIVDEFRVTSKEALHRYFPQRLPLPVKILKRLFLPAAAGRQTVFAKLTLRLFKLR
jgi:hypothetical protein